MEIEAHRVVLSVLSFYSFNHPALLFPSLRPSTPLVVPEPLIRRLTNLPGTRTHEDTPVSLWEDSFMESGGVEDSQLETTFQVKFPITIIVIIIFIIIAEFI